MPTINSIMDIYLYCNTFFNCEKLVISLKTCQSVFADFLVIGIASQTQAKHKPNTSQTQAKHKPNTMQGKARQGNENLLKTCQSVFADFLVIGIAKQSNRKAVDTMFNNIHCIEDLKSQYRKLAMMYHPDCGGSDELMKTLNAEYERLFDRFKDIHRAMSNGDTAPKSEYYTSKTATKEQAGDFIRIVTELLRMKGLEIELCGRWLWIGGDTKPNKDMLKSLGCRWSPDKKLWSWHFPEDSANPFKKRNFTMTEIRRGYGSTKFTDEERGLLGA